LRECLAKKTTVSKNAIKVLAGSELKEAVVKGALYSISSSLTFIKRPVNAYYGILYKATEIYDESPFAFKVVLKPGDDPQKVGGPIKFVKRDGLYSIDLGFLNLSNAKTDRVRLIKSYSEHPQIQFHKKRMDAISKIAELNVPDLSMAELARVPVAVKYETGDKSGDLLRLKLRVRTTESKFNNANTKLETNLSYEEVTWPFNTMQFLRDQVSELIRKEYSSPEFYEK
jgi:hypothetical protein